MKWLKQKIKTNVIILLLLCFSVVSALIWLSQHLGIKLTDGEKLNAMVLWLTALAILWYAYETYQLKKNTSDQVNIQEDIMLNEFLPIIEPLGRGAKLLKNGSFSNLRLRNLGKGPAKYIELSAMGAKINLNMSLAGGGEEQLGSADSQSAKQLASLLKARPKQVKAKISYQDIYKRQFVTNNVIFDLKSNGSYVLRPGSWDFKRISKNNRD